MTPTFPTHFPPSEASPSPHSIQLRLRDISQLFNSLDPSPFNEQDLDHDAEEFIVGWARELPRRRPLHLVVHLDKPLPEGRDLDRVGDAVRHYFAYRKTLTQLEFRELLRQGQLSLLIGLTFLALCLALGRFIAPTDASTARSIARESLTICGWVAMWRPMQLYLYDWWPILRRLRLYSRLAHVKVDMKVPSDVAGRSKSTA